MIRYASAVIGLLACAAAAQPLVSPREGKEKAVASIRCTPDTLRLDVPDTAPQNCVPLNTSGTALSNAMGNWFSKNTTIASISGSGQMGKVAAKSDGSVFVGAALKGKRDSSLVLVGNPCISVAGSLVLSPDTLAFAAPGDTASITAVLTNQCNKIDTSLAITWVSRNTGIATVTQTAIRRARATAVATGTTYIVGMSGTLKDSTKVCMGGSTIDVSPPTLALDVGGTGSLMGSVTDCGASLGTTVTWVSRAPGIASVASAGAQAATVTGEAAGVTYVVGSASGQSDSSRISVTATSGISCARTVNVSTVSALNSAIAAALPGDCINAAAGTYTLSQYPKWTRSGTAAQRITLSGVGPTTILTTNNGVISLQASYWTVRKLRITNGFTGFQPEGSAYVELDSLEIDNMTQAAVHLRWGTNNSTVRRSKIRDTGKGTAQYGEGVYIGGYASGFSGPADLLADDNKVLDNQFGPNVRAESIEISAGADRVTATGNTIDGTGTVSIYGAMNSLISVRGVNHVISNNVLSKGAPYGIDIYEGSAIFRGNQISLQTNAIGIRRVAGTVTVYCDNVVTDIQPGGSAYNVACTP
jgi:hypothetical protein